MSVLRLLVLILESITVTCTDGIKSSLCPVKLQESQIKQGPNHNSGYGERTKEPGKSLLDVNRDKGEIEGGSDGSLELRKGRDERLHLLGSLGESVLQRSDRSEDLGNTDEDIRSRNDPNVDRSGVREAICIHTRRRLVIVARRLLEDELLKNGGIQHGETGDEETGVDTFDGSKVDPDLPETWVDEFVEDGDEDDDGDWVQVLDQIVGGPVQGHSGGDGAQVTVDLGVAQPVEGEPAEHLASLEGTGDFSNELVVPGDICGDSALLVGARLGGIPETRLPEVLPGSDGVGGEIGTSSHSEDTETLFGRGDEHLDQKGRKMNENRTSRMTDPRGGVITYNFLPNRRTMGTMAKMMVGTRNATQ